MFFTSPVNNEQFAPEKQEVFGRLIDNHLLYLSFGDGICSETMLNFRAKCYVLHLDNQFRNGVDVFSIE